MLLAEADDIGLANQGFAAGVNIDVAAELFSLFDNRIDVVKRQVESVAVLCGPAASASKVASACRIEKNCPRDVAAILLAHLFLFWPGENVSVRYKGFKESRAHEGIEVENLHHQLVPVGFGLDRMRERCALRWEHVVRRELVDQSHDLFDMLRWVLVQIIDDFVQCKTFRSFGNSHTYSFQVRNNCGNSTHKLTKPQLGNSLICVSNERECAVVYSTSPSQRWTMSRNAKHIDRRVLRSRKAIIEAFDRLLEEKELDQITVSAIAREANIDRKTFYVHFGTIDGLLDALAEERVDEILDVMEDALSAASPDMELEVAVAKFFDIANQVVCTKLVDSVCRRKSFPADELLTRVLKSFKVKLVERDMLFAQIPDDLLEFHLSYIMGGIISIYKSWVNSNRSVSVEQVSQIAHELIMHGLDSLKADLADKKEGGEIRAFASSC